MGQGYEITRREGLAEIRLACGKANALNPRSLEALSEAFGEARRADAPGVVLTGYDGFFSAGLDLVLLYGLDPAAMDAFMQAFDRVMLEVFAFPRPVVAALNGHAVAGGCILALACDARVAVEGPIKIGLNEIRLGVPFPASALEIARHGLPARSLEEVLYGGELYSPAGARSRGLVDGVTGDALAEARALCARLAGQPRGAFATIKAALKAPALARARESLDPLRRAFVEAWYSPDGRERIGAARAALLR
jgi:Delta3-Delta2-enoyl-CoA isomerase